MPPAVINLRDSDDPQDVVHRAVQALAEGKLLAVPTETVYGLAASALNEEAISRLSKIKRRTAGQPFTLAIKSADDALDYVLDAIKAEDPAFVLVAGDLVMGRWSQNRKHLKQMASTYYRAGSPACRTTDVCGHSR